MRAVVHHSLDDLGKHQNLKMSTISDPAPFCLPQSQGRIKLTINPLQEANRDGPDETPLLSQACTDINGTTASLKTQAETFEQTVQSEQHKATFQNPSNESNCQDNKLEMLLSTLHHIDSDPPSPVTRLSSLFDFLDSEDDLDKPLNHQSHNENKENLVICSTPESVKPQAGSQNSTKSPSAKCRVACSKTTNRCICSLTYLTCSTSATTTTKHTNGSPRGNSSTQNGNYRAGDTTGSSNKDIHDAVVSPLKCKNCDSFPQAEMCCDQWSKLFESIQFPSVESFSDITERNQNTNDAKPNFLVDREQLRPYSEAKHHNFPQEKPSEGSIATDLELHAVPRLLDGMPKMPPTLDVIAITLTRRLPTDSFGFGLSDGIKESGIFISGIMPGGPAEDALQMYDKIIQVNKLRTHEPDRHYDEIFKFRQMESMPER